MILAIGEILIEIMATTRGNGFSAAQPLIGPFPSGAPAIFADQVARMGAPSALIGRVGDDDFGRLNIDRLNRDGVDVSGVEVAVGECTGCAFVRYRFNDTRYFVFTLAQSAAASLPLTPAANALVDACDHLHIMGSSLSTSPIASTVLSAMKRVKARNGTLSFDPNVRAEMTGTDLRARMEAVMAHTDIFLPSGAELFLLCGALDEDAAIAEIMARGVGEVVVKRGAKGASVFTQNARFDAIGHEVVEVDPTGAGDCFGGVYVALRQAGHCIEEALRSANAAGALAVTKLGPMEGAATHAEIDAFLTGAGR